MASALVDMNRSPLRRKTVLGIAPVKSTLMPCVPPLTVEPVTEIAVFAALTPSTALGPMMLPEMTRPKTDDPNVDDALLVIEMPVEAYGTAALTRAPLAPVPLRLMPPQSPALAAPVQPVTTTQ